MFQQCECKWFHPPPPPHQSALLWNRKSSSLEGWSSELPARPSHARRQSRLVHCPVCQESRSPTGLHSAESHLVWSLLVRRHWGGRGQAILPLATQKTDNIHWRVNLINKSLCSIHVLSETFTGWIFWRYFIFCWKISAFQKGTLNMLYVFKGTVWVFWRFVSVDHFPNHNLSFS